MTLKGKDPVARPAPAAPPRRSVLEVAPPPVNVAEELARSGPSPSGIIAARVYLRFKCLRLASRIPPQIPRIARALHVDEDHVWYLFASYVRGFRQLPMA